MRLAPATILIVAHPADDGPQYCNVQSSSAARILNINLPSHRYISY